MKKIITTATLLAALTAPCAAYVLGANDGEKGAAQTQSQAQRPQKQVQKDQTQKTQAQAQKAQTQSQAQKTQAQIQKGQAQKTQAQAQKAQTQAQIQKDQAQKTQAQDQTQTPVQKPRKNCKYGPDWQIGDYWIVEATNRQTQGGAQRQAKPVRWRFEVVGMARIQGRDCYQAKAEIVDAGPGNPIVHIWVDAETGALVRVANRTFAHGEWVERNQTFQGENGKTTGVFGTIPALPIDMPLFAEDGSKALGGDEEVYTTVDEEDGSKALGESAPRFTYRVKTSAQPLDVDGAKGLLDGAEGLDDAVEITMDGGVRKVRQIWTPKSPWPVYSDNGTCEARLVETNVGE